MKIRPRKPKAGSVKSKHRATLYAESVLSGDILAGRLVRLACARHIRDLETGHERGLKFDSERADHAIGYVENFCRLAGGEFEGKPFILEPSQAFRFGSLFGWIGPDGYRRFRVSYVEQGKGSGKSPEAAAVGLYMVAGDGQERAEVYSGAVHREQAAILFRHAVAMVDQSPELSELFERSGARGKEWNLAYHETNSFFRTISTENQGRGKSGPKVHCALLDEVHEHATDAMVEFMRAGAKGRQPLIYLITNSGADRNSVAWHLHQYSTKVLEAKNPDDAEWNDSWFAYVCQLDPCDACRGEGKTQPSEGCEDCDDWRDEEVWIKANPLLGVTIQREYLREQVREAIGMPSKSGTVKRLNFCIWTEGETKWLDVDLWDACAGSVDPTALRGRRCFAGLDLSETRDLSALALVFPPLPSEVEQLLKVLVWYWCPREGIVRRSRQDRVPYDVWEHEGWIEPTPGDVIDYSYIEARVLEIASTYELVEVGYDPYGSLQTIVNLGERGLLMAPVRQGTLTLSPPTKSLEVRIGNKTIRHDGNPILRWNVSNAAAVEDRTGNRKLIKPTATARIDGLAALVNAIERMERQPERAGESVYDKQGLFVL